MNDKNLKKCVFKVFDFEKKFKFLKIREFFLNLQKEFFFVLKCKQKEHVHNLNRTKNLVYIYKYEQRALLFGKNIFIFLVGCGWEGL